MKYSEDQTFKPLTVEVRNDMTIEACVVSSVWAFPTERTSTLPIISTFASRYAYFDAKRATPTVLGKAMNNFRFSFKHRIVNGCSEYWLCEK